MFRLVPGAWRLGRPEIGGFGQKLNIGGVTLVLILCYLIINTNIISYESTGDGNGNHPYKKAGS